MSPLTEKQSLMVKGTPKKGVSISIVAASLVPLWIFSSTALASAIAFSKQLSTTALMVGLTSPMRSINARTTSSLVI